MNLQADPDVEVQVSDDVFRARARDATPEEKPEMWREMVGHWPDYDEYQEKTDREIPVVVLERSEPLTIGFPAMLIFALDQATTTTIVYIFIWGIAFPALVTGLIVYAIVQARGEKQDNEENRRFRRSLAS